jgi:restriction endonuclease
MKLSFDPDQPHQLDAIAAVIDVLAGQPYLGPSESIASCRASLTVANRLTISPQRLAENVAVVQRRGALPVQGSLGIVRGEIDTSAGPRLAEFPNLTVDMETGTGKTYVFVRTALELARRYGLRKFVVVVPAVAIREGVLKTLQVTRDHLQGLYPDVSYRFFAHDRARPDQTARFARAGTVEIMVVTIDAFNKASNVLRQPSDRFGGAAPIDLIRATRPVLVLDEPHHLASALRVQALCDLDPLLALRYGATHRQHHALVHRLTPAVAHTRGLVKTIEVVGATAGGSREARFSGQIRATIEAHLRRQNELHPLGIKVLSLLFVDRVDSYVGPEALVRTLFDHHFDQVKGDFARYARLPAAAVRTAYFAQRRRRGHAEPVDSRSGESAADAAAYQLIMRDKERLLSFDEPAAFVFSHSALREGWDNPNVFQICTLGRSQSAIKKRQEIGRGIRLCVDQNGQRVPGREVNVLQVIANESYEDWVGGLQSEWENSVPPEARAPVPTPAGRASTRTGAETRTSPAVARPVDRAMLERVARELAAWLEDRPALPASDGALPNLVDAVHARLATLPVRVWISRASILAILEQLPDPDLLEGDLHAVTEALVTRLRHAALAHGAS